MLAPRALRARAARAPPLARARSGAAGAGLKTAPPVAWALAGAGLAPFFWYAAQHAPLRSAAGAGAPWGDALLASLPGPLGGAALAALGSGDQAGARDRFATYSAVILSFVGALHWGAAAAAPTAFARAQLVGGVAPALVAWAALAARARGGPADASASSALMLLAGGFVGTHFLDVAAAEARPTAAVPAWFIGLRTPLTAAVLGAHCLAMYAVRDPSISDAAWAGREGRGAGAGR
jgi:hypothetical protein